MSKERSTPTAAAAPNTRCAVSRAAGSGSELDQLRAEREAVWRELDDARARIAQLERLADEASLAPTESACLPSRVIAHDRLHPALRAPSSVTYFDVNGLKQINDTHGHPAGDAALRHIADVCRRTCARATLSAGWAVTSSA